MNVQEIFFICLLCGILLICAEIFVPGGVLGAVGALALIGAMVTGFMAFEHGLLVAMGIIILAGVAIVLWIKYFPKSRIGRSMTANVDLGDAEATEEGLTELVGLEGEAMSDLRPAGYARFNGRRIDVVTQGNMLSKGERVKVVEVEGNRVVVRKVMV